MEMADLSLTQGDRLGPDIAGHELWQLDELVIGIGNRRRFESETCFTVSSRQNTFWKTGIAGPRAGLPCCETS
jgi:hypothetical protein